MDESVKITIDIDTEKAGAVVAMDGKKINLQALKLQLFDKGGEIKISRLTLGYGNKFMNREEKTFRDDGTAWRQL